MNTPNITYRTELEKGSRKAYCPSCNQKSFVFEIDIESNEIIDETVGRCDRENNCGYHYTAKQYFSDNPGKKPQTTFVHHTEEQESPIEFISIEYIEKSMQGFKSSHFASFIITLFGEEIACKLLLKYFVGRSKNDNGKACVFWQIDELNQVRYGKIMSYDVESGKRRKDLPPMAVPVKPINYLQTFFGCHLLSEHPHKPVAIVESEKTAIIASFFMPQYNWLATGGSSGCKWREYSVFKILQGKEVVMYPDFGFYSKPTSKPQSEWKTCYQEWNDRAMMISEKIKCKITVSKILENNLPESERINGPDIADVLIKRDETGRALTDFNYPAIWDYRA